MTSFYAPIIKHVMFKFTRVAHASVQKAADLDVFELALRLGCDRGITNRLRSIYFGGRKSDLATAKLRAK